ncbi:Phototropin-1 [Terramyces sp. JEL0728]|nr:Phototropin-1 [Terramyces sp. JEL0728]
MAPEVFNNGEYSFPVDFWALGVTFYETVSGQRPFKSRNRRELIKKGKFSFASDIPLSEDCRNCISEFLQVNPEMRLGCGEAGISKLHSQKYFRSIRWNQVENKYNVPVYRRPQRIPCEDIDIPEIRDFTKARGQAASFKQEYQKIFNDFTYYDYTILKPFKFTPITIPESSLRMLKEDYNDISYIDNGFATRNNSFKRERDSGILKPQPSNVQSDQSPQNCAEEPFHIGGLRSFTSYINAEDHANSERNERPVFASTMSQMEKRARFEKKGNARNSFIKNESRSFSPSHQSEKRRFDDLEPMNHIRKKDLHSPLNSTGDFSPEDDSVILFPFRTPHEEEMQNTVSNPDKAYVSNSTIGIANYKSSTSSLAAIKSFHKNSQQSIGKKTPLSSLLWLEFPRSSDIRRKSANIEEEIEHYENAFVGTPTSQLSHQKRENADLEQIGSQLSDNDSENPPLNWVRRSVASIGKSASIFSQQSHLSVRSNNADGKIYSPAHSFGKNTFNDNNLKPVERRLSVMASLKTESPTQKLENFPSKSPVEQAAKVEAVKESLLPEPVNKLTPAKENGRISTTKADTSGNESISKSTEIPVSLTSGADTNVKGEHSSTPSGQQTAFPVNPLFLNRKPSTKLPGQDGVASSPSIRRRRAQTFATGTKLEDVIQMSDTFATRLKNESEPGNEAGKSLVSESRASIPPDSINAEVQDEKDKRDQTPDSNTLSPKNNVDRERAVEKRASLPAHSRSESVPWPSGSNPGTENIKGRENSVKQRSMSSSQDSQILIQLQKPTFIDPHTGKSVKPSPLQKSSRLQNQMGNSGTVGSLTSVDSESDTSVKKTSVRKPVGLNRIDTNVLKEALQAKSAPNSKNNSEQTSKTTPVKSPSNQVKLESVPVVTANYYASPRQSIIDIRPAGKIAGQTDKSHIPKSPTVPKNFFQDAFKTDSSSLSKSNSAKHLSGDYLENDKTNRHSFTSVQDNKQEKQPDSTINVSTTEGPATVKNHRAERRISQMREAASNSSVDGKLEKSNQSLPLDPDSTTQVSNSLSSNDVQKSIPRRLDKLDNRPKILESSPNVIKSALLTND